MCEREGGSEGGRGREGGREGGRRREGGLGLGGRRREGGRNGGRGTERVVRRQGGKEWVYNVKLCYNSFIAM